MLCCCVAKLLFGNKAHTARALCVAWSPDCMHLATGGLDSNIVIWKNEKGRYNTVATVTGGRTLLFFYLFFFKCCTKHFLINSYIR